MIRPRRWPARTSSTRMSGSRWARTRACGSSAWTCCATTRSTPRSWTPRATATPSSCTASPPSTTPTPWWGPRSWARPTCPRGSRSPTRSSSPRRASCSTRRRTASTPSRRCWLPPSADETLVSGEAPPQGGTLGVRQAAFIGVGAMVGAGIFSLLGAAGEVAGAAVWISFLIAGIVAMLQGYSFAKFGARYPSAGGLLEYVIRGFGDGHATGIMAWLIYSVNAIITAMVAISFGSYATEAFANGSTAWLKVFAVGVIAAMTLLNMVGSKAVARVQPVVVVVVISILSIFAVTTLANAQAPLLAPSGYPPFKDIIS